MMIIKNTGKKWIVDKNIKNNVYKNIKNKSPTIKNMLKKRKTQKKQKNKKLNNIQKMIIKNKTKNMLKKRKIQKKQKNKKLNNIQKIKKIIFKMIITNKLRTKKTQQPKKKTKKKQNPKVKKKTFCALKTFCAMMIQIQFIIGLINFVKKKKTKKYRAMYKMIQLQVVVMKVVVGLIHLIR